MIILPSDVNYNLFAGANSFGAVLPNYTYNSVGGSTIPFKEPTSRVANGTYRWDDPNLPCYIVGTINTYFYVDDCGNDLLRILTTVEAHQLINCQDVVVHSSTYKFSLRASSTPFLPLLRVNPELSWSEIYFGALGPNFSLL